MPFQGGRVRRVRVAPDGSGGSIGWKSGGYKEISNKKGGGEILTTSVDEEGTGGFAKTWTTIGVDYSKASGAEVALVAVAGYHGFNGRPVTWAIDIGDVSEDEVTFKDMQFTVRPKGSQATMTGTVVYPPTMRFEYVPGEDGQGARINTWMKIPPPDLEEAFFDSLSDKVLDIRKFVIAEDSVGADIEGDLDIDDLDDIDGPSPAEQKQRQQVSRQVKSKVFRVTTSNKMGSPYLRTRVNNHVVVVLTIQNGAAPKVAPLPVNHDGFLTIGKQQVNYWEFLVEFERGMKESIHAHTPR